MKEIKIAIILIITVCNYFSANAQENRVIRGRVLDEVDNTAIIGANVVEYDSQDRIVNGTITDVNGDFVLKMDDPSHTVRISVIGYNGQEIEVDFSQTIRVELQPSSVDIGEVTVTASAKSSNSLLNIEERDKTSSSVKLDLLEMGDAGLLGAADAMQGKVSGLDIISASGDPGSGSNIVIRGLSSMGNSRPLVVIDGIPQFNVGEGTDLASADSEDISNLINVALQDIKSIEVLKDAGATSIYGSRGADGVLVIETKKGRMGDVQFDFQYQNRLNIQPPSVPMLNGDEYIMLQLEEWHNNRGVFDLDQFPEIAYDRNFSDFYNYSANTNWLEAITQNGRADDYYFSVSGGAEKTRFFTSFSYLDETGTTTNTSAQRFSTRINLDYFISRDLLFQIKFDYFTNNTDGNLKVSNRNVREMAYIKAPNMSIWEYDENGRPTGEYFTPINSYQGNGSTFFNPVAVANLGRNDKVTNQLKNSFMLQYRLYDWLIFRQTVSLQFKGDKDKTYLPHNAIGADWLNWNINQAGERNRLNQGIRTESQISFNAPFQSDAHSLSGAFSWITDQNSNEWMTVISSRLPSTDIQDPAVNPHINNIRNGRGEDRMLSGVGNMNYKYLDRYLLTYNARLDGHSSFGSDNRWGLFQGLSLGWRFSSEPFMQSLDFLGESKLRFSWGVSGRQPKDVYARFATYQSTSNGSYMLNPAVQPTSIELSNLRWENQSSLTLGLELNLFKDRLYIVSEVYESVTTDILFGGERQKDYYNIPYSSGFSGLQYFNAGEMTNRGWELMADAKIVDTDDWLLSVDFNISHNNNTFNRFPDNFNNEESTDIGNGDFPKLAQEGEAIGSFFGFRYLGVWAKDEDVVARDATGNIILDGEGNPIPFMFSNSYTFKGGDPIYEDINHDGKIDLNDVVYIGDSNPDFIGGFGTRLKYKNFDFSASFHYRVGFDIVNGIAIQTEGMNSRDNQSKAVLRRWRAQGQDEEGMLPRAYMNHPANNLGSDRYVEPGDYLRLNTLKVGYRFSKNICNRLGIRTASISLSARKLYTFTRYSGQDPEIPQNASNPFWMGVDEARTPPPKVYTVDLRIGL